MIEINLLPDELKKKEPKFKQIDLSKISLKELPILKLLGAGAVVLATINILLFLVGLYANMHLKAVEEHYSKISTQRKEAEALRQQVLAINKKVRAIDELMVQRFSWAKKLNDLSDSMTPGIWLTDLSYSGKVVDKPVTILLKGNRGNGGLSKTVIQKVPINYMIISGYASSMGEEGTALIGKFIKSLKENSDFYSDFADIELGAIKRDKIENQEVMSFQITCLFKEQK